jgi:hypothetical protein
MDKDPLQTQDQSWMPMQAASGLKVDLLAANARTSFVKRSNNTAEKAR